MFKVKNVVTGKFVKDEKTGRVLVFATREEAELHADHLSSFYSCEDHRSRFVVKQS